MSQFPASRGKNGHRAHNGIKPSGELFVAPMIQTEPLKDYGECATFKSLFGGLCPCVWTVCKKLPHNRLQPCTTTCLVSGGTCVTQRFCIAAFYAIKYAKVRRPALSVPPTSLSAIAHPEELATAHLPPKSTSEFG
jgi:hypothetical protein